MNFAEALQRRRVAFGWLFAAAFVLFARPTPAAVAAGAVLVAVVWLPFLIERLRRKKGAPAPPAAVDAAAAAAATAVVASTREARISRL